jgi:glycolate oxidase FAD binding subunit
MASDLIPSALDLADGATLRAAGLGGPDGCAVLVGVDGLREQVEWQQAELARLTGVAVTALDGEGRDNAWRALGELPRRAFDQPTAVLRCSVLPSQVADVMDAARAAAQGRGLTAALRAHAGVGMVVAVLGNGGGAAEVTATLEEWRALVNARGGHALLEWAPLAVKERVSVWDSPGPAHRIMKRLKSELDPRGILNPGRFAGGI